MSLYQEQIEVAMQGVPETLRPIVEKEIFHYEIMSFLQENGFLSELVFMGGTSLRLCYGSNRFSEDLDFAAGKHFKLADFADMSAGLKQHIEKSFKMPVRIKDPKGMSLDTHSGVNVSKWQVVINTAPERKNIPSQHIKIEMADVPAYDVQTRPILVNYSGVGLDGLLIPVESQQEIMADKLVSLPMASYVRYRDIWDLAWLSTKGASLDVSLIERKLDDYHVPLSTYQERLLAMQNKLPVLIQEQNFAKEMERFLKPESAEKLRDERYAGFIEHTVQDFLKRTRATLSPTPAPSSAMKFEL